MYLTSLILSRGLFALAIIWGTTRILQSNPHILHATSIKNLAQRFIAAIAVQIAKWRIAGVRSWLNRELDDAGLSEKVRADEYLAQCLFCGGALALGLSVMLMINGGTVPLTMVALMSIVVTVVIFYLRIVDHKKSREISSRRDLPYLIDYLSLCMDAGMDFNQGLACVVDEAPSSPILGEFSRMVRYQRLGVSRDECLGELIKRMPYPNARIFAQTLRQAMVLGTDVVSTLEAIAESMRTARFQKSEEAAGKISVRMMVPMMVFVLPSTIIVLLGPLMLEWLKTM